MSQIHTLTSHTKKQIVGVITQYGELRIACVSFCNAKTKGFLKHTMQNVQLLHIPHPLEKRKKNLTKSVARF